MEDECCENQQFQDSSPLFMNDLIFNMNSNNGSFDKTNTICPSQNQRKTTFLEEHNYCLDESRVCF